MKQTCKWAFGLLMTLVLTASLFAGAAAAAGGDAPDADSGVTVEVSVSPAEVGAGRTNTVVMTVKTDAAVDVAVFNFDIVCPDGWAVTAITSDVPGFDENCYSLANRKTLWYNSANVTTDTLATVTFTIPSDAAEDEYTVGVAEVAMGRFTDSGEAEDLAPNASASATVTVRKEYNKGDVNGDGMVNAIDAMLVLRASGNLITLTDAQSAAADVNGDSIINSADVQLILSYSIGKITALG